MNLEQWLAWRRKGIGSSDAAAIMGFSKWGNPLEVFLERTGRIKGRKREPWEWKAMERGRILEPAARAAYEARTGIIMPAKCVIHSEKFQWLRSSLDGLNLAAEKAAVELKAPGAEDHAKAMRGEITDYGFWQCVHHLMVTELNQIDFASFRDGELAPIISVHRDWKFEKQLFQAEKEMWERIQNDDPPFSPGFRKPTVFINRRKEPCLRLVK